MKRGFTLIELLVVISIIGILLTVMAVSYVTAQKRGRDSKRMGDIKAMQKSLEECYVLDGQYPDTADVSGGSSLVCGSSKTVMNYVPFDPKNSSPYIYNYSISSSNDSYCLCALLERSDSGNATTAGASGVCSFSTGPDNNYQCVSSQQ